MKLSKYLFGGALGTALLFAATLPGTAADLDPAVKTIQDIQEAGINECEGAPDDLGRRFYQTVVDACVGKVSCQVGVTDAESEATLRSFGCTNFFVVAICGPNDLQQYTSDGLSEPLSVFCDAP
jgi:hypothetical protein